MQLIYFFSTYFLFLLASAIAITSFFCVTRGYTETAPDGTERRYGKVLKGYFFFWYREKSRRRIYYTDDALAELVHRLGDYYRETVHLPGDPFRKGTMTRFEASAAIRQMIPLLRKALDVRFEVSPAGGDRVEVKAFSEEPVYVFPEWLRTVMAGCITCTPTVYGNVTFWTCVILFRKTVFFTVLTGPFAHPVAGLIVVWLAYWVSLAWLNTVLWHWYER